MSHLIVTDSDGVSYKLDNYPSGLYNYEEQIKNFVCYLQNQVPQVWAGGEFDHNGIIKQADVHENGTAYYDSEGNKLFPDQVTGPPRNYQWQVENKVVKTDEKFAYTPEFGESKYWDAKQQKCLKPAA
jgi:hypothetical protein